jgi:hypothetical protein
MSEQAARTLFDQWERVWHKHQHDLIGDCVAPQYVRNEEACTRRVTPVEYAKEILATKRERPNIRITV